MGDKRTGLANWKLNNITHLNDFKWTKPGHITFKIFANNLLPCQDSQPASKSTLKRKSGNHTRPLSNSSTFNEFRMSMSHSSTTESILNNSFNVISELEMLTSLSKSKDGFIFAALRFENDFECSKFFDFYRNLFVDSKNDDLFNPHYKPSTEKTSSIRVCLKKITKSSISSPCAFHHINSLSVVEENEFSSSSSSSVPLNSSSDTQSLSSEMTPNSLNNSSIIANNYSNKK